MLKFQTFYGVPAKQIIFCVFLRINWYHFSITRMQKEKKYLLLILVAVLLNVRNSYSQTGNYRDSLAVYYAREAPHQLSFHNTVGTSFTYMPKYGSITGLSFSSFLSYPLSNKFSVQGGFMVGKYFSALRNLPFESSFPNTFNTLSMFGSATYQLNERLSFYGLGIKQIGGFIPYANFPTGSFTIGSTLNFGSFSIGAAVSVTERNDYFFNPYGGNRDFFPGSPW